VDDNKPNYQAPFKLPRDATEVALVRHGASAAHEPDATFGLVDGHSDPPLAARGHEQARRLAERLRLEPVAALFVTPLMRTAETAAPLVRHTGLTPVVVPELREIHLGVWEADGGFQRHDPERAALRARVLEEQDWGLIPGAERNPEFGLRVQAGLEKVAAATGPDRLGVAIVHGGVIAQACHAITGSQPFAFIATQNCSITRLIRLEDGRWILQVYNDTAHLDAR
jgi:probable phosphoglycerate mutase